MVNIGFFYLREKGAASDRKCGVYVKEGVIHIWEGKVWRQYDEYEPCEAIADRIKACEEFNGPL